MCNLKSKQNTITEEEYFLYTYYNKLDNNYRVYK